MKTIKRWMQVTVLLVSVTSLSPAALVYSVIAGWEAANVPGDLGAVAKGPGIGNAVVSRGGGLIADTRYPGYYDSYGWNESLSFPGMASEDYLSIRILFDDGVTATLSKLSIAYSGAGSVLAPQALELRSSTDGFSGTLSGDTSVASFPNIDVQEVDLSHLGAVQGSIEFRLWGYSSPGGVSDDPAAILGLTNSPALSGGGTPMAIVLEGITVPEPSVGVLLSLVMLGFLRTRRRTG